MSETKIEAEVRSNFGKGAARKLRAAGRTPAVIYGHGNATRHIHVPAHQVALALRTKNALLELNIAGKEELVLVKSAAKDPVTQVIEHIDLVEVRRGEKVHVEVPVHIVGEVMGAIDALIVQSSRTTVGSSSHSAAPGRAADDLHGEVVDRHNGVPSTPRKPRRHDV